MSNKAEYLPALRFRLLTPLFDPLLRYVMREIAFKRRLVEEAHIPRGSKVLDLGCGTGTLTILTKRMHPDARVIGIDGDIVVEADLNECNNDKSQRGSRGDQHNRIS